MTRELYGNCAPVAAPHMRLADLSGRFAALGMLLAAAVIVAAPASAKEIRPNCGELNILDDHGEIVGACPLEHTDVVAHITGMIVRVTVTQKYTNPTNDKIEAIYTFPLPADAAVDDMVMTVGDRRVIGQIKERGEARAIYEAARAAGHVTSLLDQERPNIFTQSVANIEPGATVVIEISYVHLVGYDEGQFTFSFPMVVGPRYIPGGGSAPAPGEIGRRTSQVPDGDRITPPVTPPGTRAGHDISVRVALNAGLAIGTVESELHDVSINRNRDNATSAEISLASEAEIPNRDFILHWTTPTETIGDALLVEQHVDGDYFMLMLQPPARIVPQQLTPRELVFVLDTSGSMSGDPIEASKRLMKEMIGTMRAGDTFNIITFAGTTKVLWSVPRPNTEQNVAEAQEFVANLRGGGGTEMMKAINAALEQGDWREHKAAPRGDGRPFVRPLRIVTFMTDGYVGNDFEIIDAVRKNAATTRVFSFGVGNSVNRFLLDGMAHAGRGVVEYVTLGAEADAIVDRFHERVLSPVLTDIQVDYSGAPVADVVPAQIPDLFSAKPILIFGRLTGAPQGEILVNGLTGEGPVTLRVSLDELSLPEAGAPADASIASMWARAKVDALMNQDLAAMQSGEFPDELKQQVIDLGLRYRLMTQFTSFVAVEEMTVTVGGEPKTVRVPVEMPEGVSYEGVFGAEARGGGKMATRAAYPANWLGQAPTGAAPRQPSARPRGRDELRALQALGYVGGDEDSADAEAPAALGPQAKLAKALRDLAARVTKASPDTGTAKLDGVQVTAWRVTLMLFVRDLTDETREALEAAGFKVSDESSTVKMFVGEIDVRKLDALAKLDAVVQVRPVTD